MLKKFSEQVGNQGYLRNTSTGKNDEASKNETKNCSAMSSEGESDMDFIPDVQLSFTYEIKYFLV